MAATGPIQSPPPPTEPVQSPPLASTIPPFIGGQQLSPAQQTPQAPPPPPPDVVTQTTAPKNGSGGLKRILVVLAIAVLVLVLVGALVSLVLPRLRGGGSTGEITWWGLWEDEEIIQPLIDDYQRQNPGVTVKYVSQSKEDYRDRLRSAIDRGEAPDIFRFHNTWVPMFAQDLDTLPASAMSAQEFVQTFYPVAAQDLTVSGGILGIPLEYDGLGLFINEEIFATYTKTPPTTWDELRQTAIDLTIKNESGIIQQSGVAMGNAKNVDHWQEILALMMIQNGVNLANPIDEFAVNALEYYTAYTQQDGVWDETMPASTTAFAAGKLAMYFGPSWRAFEIKQQNPNLQFRVVAVPQLPSEDSEAEVTYASYWVEGVWTEGTNKEAAWDFLAYLSQKESLEKFYNNAAQIRGFGEPYPRRDMRDLILTHPILGGIIRGAPDAKSWYLVARTFDGDTGINSRISKYFEDAVNSVTSSSGGGSAERALQTAAAGVQQVLQGYGVISTQAPAQ